MPRTRTLALAVLAASAAAFAPGCSACRVGGDDGRRPAVRRWLRGLRGLDVAALRTADGRVDHPAFDHFTGETGAVALTLAPDLVAAWEPDAASDDGAPDEHRGFRRLADAGISLADAADRRRVLADRTGRARRRRAGVPALLPVDGAAADDWPAVVLTPEIVVRFRTSFICSDPATIPERVAALLDPLGADPVDSEPTDRRLWVCRARGDDPAAWLEASRRISALPECEKAAHPDLVVPHRRRSAAPQDGGGAAVPDDPLVGEQWHLRNTGQGGGAPGADCGAAAAWEVTRGTRRTVVAVIDGSGVQWNHPDLAANVAPGGRDFVDRDLDPGPSAGHAHGTAAAGLVAAVAGNGIGGCGVAPGCRVLPIRAADGATTPFDDARAIRYAVQQGADVISCSWGFDAGTPESAWTDVRDAIRDAATSGRGGRGTVVVWALSNERRDNFAPPRDVSATSGVIAVGRVNNADQWGRCGWGAGMSLLAPSHAGFATADGPGALPPMGDAASLGTLDVVTTDVAGSAGDNVRGGARCPRNFGLRDGQDLDYTACFGGTSAAAPIVAGVAALVLSVDETLTAAEVRDVLESTAVPVDRDDPEAQWTPDARGRLRSPTRGYGRVDAGAAVREALRRRAARAGGAAGAAAR